VHAARGRRSARFTVRVFAVRVFAVRVFAVRVFALLINRLARAGKTRPGGET
jgi:hypothetical protein